MKSFEIKGLGLEEMSHDELFYDGGFYVTVPLGFNIFGDFIQGIVDGIKEGYNKENN